MPRLRALLNLTEKRRAALHRSAPLAIAAFAVLFLPRHQANGQDLVPAPFHVPVSAEVEYLGSSRFEVEGFQVQSVEDAVAFAERLESADLSDASLTSWKFLGDLGLAKVERAPVPPPEGGGEVRRLPEWHEHDVAIDGPRIDYNSTAAGRDHRVVSTSDAVVDFRTYDEGIASRVDHYLAGGGGYSLPDIAELMGRSEKFADPIWRVGQREDGLMTAEREGPVADSLFVCVGTTEPDAVRIYLGSIGGKVKIADFYVGALSVPGAPFQVPEAVLSVRPSSDGRAKCKAYKIRQAEFDVPVDAARFQFYATPGDVYTAYSSSGDAIAVEVPSNGDSIDLASVAPSDAMFDLGGIDIEAITPPAEPGGSLSPLLVWGILGTAVILVVGALFIVVSRRASG